MFAALIGQDWLAQARDWSLAQVTIQVGLMSAFFINGNRLARRVSLQGCPTGEYREDLGLIRKRFTVVMPSGPLPQIIKPRANAKSSHEHGPACLQ